MWDISGRSRPFWAQYWIKRLANAHSRIEEKQCEAELVSEGFAPEQIRKYGFAFQRKTCMIG